MEAVIMVFVLLFVFAVALGGYATVKAVGAAKRTADRHLTQARRTVEEHTLRAKSLVQTGPAAELAHLRLRLRTSMRATQEALHAGMAEDASVRESFTLFQRLSAHGHELDGDLRRLESEPDRAALAARLPELRERTERIIGSADALRWAARDRARRFADDDLDTLSAQIDVEAGALRHWARAEPGATPPPWPKAPGADTPGARQDWPEDPGRDRAGEAEAAPPPAITPPGRRLGYPWQKKARPESTT